VGWVAVVPRVGSGRTRLAAAMDVGVGDLDALSRWIRFWTTGAILIISMVAWFGGLGDKSIDAPTMRLRNESKKAFRGLAVPVSAVNPVAKKEEPPEEDKKSGFRRA